MEYKLYKGDCLKMMDKLIEEGVKVDMVLTDPPYGTTACKWDSVIPLNRYIVIKEGKRDKILYKDEFILRKLKEGINVKEIEKEWKENSKEGMWDKLNKLIKPNGAIVLFGSQPFSGLLINSNIKKYKHSWVWHKKNAGNLLVAKYQPLKTTEDIMVFTNKGERVNYYPIMSGGHKDRSKDNPTKKRSDLYNTIKSGQFKHGNNKRGDERYPKHLITFSNASRKDHYHPTQKPVDLLEYLIKTYTNEYELVLDFTMGSGSTGVACINTNRKFIGIELDENYFNIAKKRIEDVEERIKKIINKGEDIMNMKIDRTGEERVNKFGSKMIIKEYRNNMDVDVYFPEYDWTFKHTQYYPFKNGSIKCPYEPRYYGKGYLGEGKYKAFENGKGTDKYDIWHSMLMRCYDPKLHERNPTYKGCKVEDYLLNFQNMGEWIEDNYYEIPGEQMCLDKDILYKGNKVYSRETCIFVPQRINKLFVKSDKSRGKDPIGMTELPEGNYQVQCHDGYGKNIYLGTYSTKIEAFQAYKNYKEKVIKEVIDSYKGIIPEPHYSRLKTAMYNYEVEIDD